MHKKFSEPAAFIFPLPDDLKEQYVKWSNSFEQTQKENEDQGFTPVFIPVYPAYPGSVPYPPLISGGNCPPGRGAPTWFSGVNPFILFLIFILLIIGFKKDQILSAIRKLILKNQ